MVRLENTAAEVTTESTQRDTHKLAKLVCNRDLVNCYERSYFLPNLDLLEGTSQ